MKYKSIDHLKLYELKEIVFELKKKFSHFCSKKNRWEENVFTLLNLRFTLIK